MVALQILVLSVEVRVLIGQLMKTLIFTLLITLLTGCNLFKAGSETEKAVSQPHEFPFPQIPTMINSQEDMVQYLSDNFWKPYLDSAAKWNVSSADSLVGGVKKEDLHAAMTSYFMLLWDMPTADAIRTQTTLMAQISRYDARFPQDSLYDFFARSMHDALYDPVSDFRNEEFYLPVLESMMARDSGQIQLQVQSDVCRKNRIGERIADFSFTKKDGRQSSLYRSATTDYTLIFFSNPGCPACGEIIAEISSNPKIEYMTGQGALTILNIYIDEDLTEWYKHLDDYPANWTSGYNEDLSIRDGRDFVIRAIPSVYVIDRQHRTLLKDVSLPFLKSFFERL